MVQAHIIFSGTVQGVGFRFTVQRCAVNLDLTGWVKNRSDGSVEILAEGPKEKIEDLCRHVEDYFEGYIRNRDIQFTPAQEEFKRFEIA